MIIIRRVVGHSMLPVLPPGTTVVARRVFKKPIVDTVVIVRHEGKEKIKRISKIKDNQIFVVGDNPTHSKDSHDFGWIPSKRILGKVIWPKNLGKIDD
jgi:nickel-type superoxide dismutase maturation protease